MKSSLTVIGYPKPARVNASHALVSCIQTRPPAQNRRPPERIVYQGADAIRQVWLTKLVCSFAEVALEDGQPAAQVLTQEVGRRAELLLCANDVRWRLQPEDAEDEPVVAAALADFERDLWFWLMLWSEAAEVAFGNLIDHDRAIRQRLAAQLERLEQESILFGARPAA